MAEERDYYDILGVGRNATPDEIKTAFRNNARKYHPDINKDPDAEDKFKEINEAYQVLSDDDKRAAYDRFGKAGVNGTGGFDYSTVDLSDIFGDLFGFGGFGGFGGASARQRRTPRQGSNLSMRITLDFLDACFGTTKEITFDHDEECEHCHGTGAEPGTKIVRCATCGGTGEVKTQRQTMFGQMVQLQTCPTCNGRGETISTPCSVCRGRKWVRKTVKRMLNIPAGVDNGTRIRLAGEGQPGENGGPKGDMLVELNVKPHEYFRRVGNDIELNLNLNVAQATLGDEIDVPTIHGVEKLIVPEGTQPGKVFTMRNRGVPVLQRKDQFGDQRVTVNVVIPKDLNDEQRALMESFGKTLGTEVIPQDRNFWDKLKDRFNG